MTILNRQYGYLFIHIPKVAGKSIKQHLIRHSFAAPQRAGLRTSFALEAVSSYAGGNALAAKVIPALHGPGIDGRIRAYCAARGYRTSAHLTAAELVDALGQDAFHGLFSFAFVRNPWDRCLSAYFYFQRKTLHPLHGLAAGKSYEDFLVALEEMEMAYVGQQTLWLCDDEGHQLVDYVGKIESIDADIATVGRKVGLPVESFAERTNVSTERERDYRGYYTPKAMDIIERTMARDIALLDYSFE